MENSRINWLENPHHINLQPAAMLSVNMPAVLLRLLEAMCHDIVITLNYLPAKNKRQISCLLHLAKSMQAR